MKYAVTHDAQNRRFETIVDDNSCTLDYELAENTMTITHTRVPEPVEGRGIAAALMQAALEHARASGWRVLPKCSYAVAYFARHPEWSDLRADA